MVGTIGEAVEKAKSSQQTRKAPTIHVDVVSAEALVFAGEAEFVVLPGEMGELGVYPRHAPLLTRVKSGAVRIKSPGGKEVLVFVSGGIIEVQPEVVTVLADTAIRGKDLDEAKALEAKQRAEAALQAAADKREFATVEAELALLAAQLATIRRFNITGNNINNRFDKGDAELWSGLKTPEKE